MSSEVLRLYLHFWSILFKIYHFIFLFLIRFWQPFWEAILNFMVKTVLKHKKYPSIRFLTSELERNDTSFVSMTHLILNITVYVFSLWCRCLLLGSHIWFQGHDGPEHSKIILLYKYYIYDARVNRKLHIICLFVQFVSRVVTFSGFQCGVGSHFGLPSWIWKSRQIQNAMNINLSDLQSQN